MPGTGEAPVKVSAWPWPLCQELHEMLQGGCGHFRGPPLYVLIPALLAQAPGKGHMS